MGRRLPRFRSEAVHLYLPNKNRPVDGVFVCLVFTSPDPREFADVWNFALVTIPFPFTYDLGDKDHRNQSRANTHEPQGMQLLLRYLDDVAKQTNHPELSKVPIVGWMGQAGSLPENPLRLQSGTRARLGTPSSILRSEAFANLPYKVPFAYSWKSTTGERQRRPENAYPITSSAPCSTTLDASTYGFKHLGSFFDRQLFQKLKPIIKKPVGGSRPPQNGIRLANSEEAKAFVFPSWLPDKSPTRAERQMAYGSQIRSPKRIRLLPLCACMEVNVDSKVIYYDGENRARS